MNLPEYKKQICVTLNDRDFYGFVEKEGEAWIENNVLHINTRSNNPMSDQKGEYVHSAYEIIEYYSEFSKIKVKYFDFVQIFDLSTAEFCYSQDSLILENEQLDLLNKDCQKEILDFVLVVLAYLYRIESNDAELIRNILVKEWNSKEIQLFDLPCQIQMKIYHLVGLQFSFHQLNNQHIFNVSHTKGMPKKRLVFNFYTGYFVPHLKQHFLSYLPNYKNWVLL